MPCYFCSPYFVEQNWKHKEKNRKPWKPNHADLDSFPFSQGNNMHILLPSLKFLLSNSFCIVYQIFYIWFTRQNKFLMPLWNMERHAIVRTHYKEIIFINVKHDNRNSMDMSNNTVRRAFIDNEILSTDLNFHLYNGSKTQGTSWLSCCHMLFWRGQMQFRWLIEAITTFASRGQLILCSPSL